MSVFPTVLAATIRTTTPLVLAASGELVTERAGVINIGLEGAIILGALAATVSAPVGGTSFAYAAGLLAGALTGMLMAVFVVFLRTDQIISGTAVAMLGLGLAAALYSGIYGTAGVALSIPTSPAVRLPGIAALPLVGGVLFDQPLVTYFAYVLPVLLWTYLYRTHHGLALRAVGEEPTAARVAGVRVSQHRAGAIIFGSALGGLAGAVLVLAQAGTFAEGMSAGRGFIAIAIVALGQWHPVGVALAAIAFGAAMAFQYAAQSLGWGVRYELVLMFPYALTLGALVFAPRRTAPAALARSE